MAIEDQAQTTILAIGVDTGNSVQEFQKVSAAADKMGGVISNAADVAAAALERQGQAQEQAAKQSKRSTDAAVRTLQTEIAAREAGGRATARYYELIYANSSRVDQQAIAPLIAKYKELEAQQVAAAAASKQRAEAEKKAAQDAAAAVQAQIEAQKAAVAAAAARAANAQPQRGAGVPGGSVSGLPDISEGTRQLEKMGMTAKATSAALRQVPAQFTDIVVSLQGGQAPLTVFLQQGGQLKDVFGGAGAAASALGKYVLGLINPLSLTVAAIAAIGLATYNASEDFKALNTVLIATGNRAGTTSGQFANIAESLSKQGFSFSQSAAALVEFARAGVNVGDRLESITRSALDLEKYGGQAVKKTAEDFASLAKDPLTASLELNKQLGYLTRGTVEYINKLLMQGDVVKAAAVAQEAYADSARRSAEAYKANLGPIDTALNFYTEKGKKMWDALRGLVGPDTGNEQLAKLQSQLANVRSVLDGQKPSLPGQESSATKELLTQEKLLLNQINYFGRVNEAAKIAGEQEGKRTRQVQLTGEWLTKYASASEKQAAAEKRIRLEGIELGKTELQIQQAIAVSRGKQSAGSKPTIKVDENLRELSQYTASLVKRIEKEQQLTEVQKAQAAIARAASNDANGQVQAYILDLAAQFDAEEATTAARKASEAALKKYNDELNKSADSVEKTVQKYKDESAAVALAISQRISLEAAINDVNIARLEERALLEYQGGNFDGLAATQREIKDRKELAKEIRSKDVREANDKAAKSAADSWKKAADQIEQSITDALLRGFESGKGFGENLRDTLQNMFKTMVLRPIISAVVNPIANAATNFLSTAGGTAGSWGSASSLPGMLGNITIAGSSLAAITGSVATGVQAGWAGTSIAAASEAYAAAGMKGVSTGLTAGSTIGSALAAIPGWGWAAMGVLAIASMKGSYVQSLGESVATVTGDKLVTVGGSGGNNDVSIGGGLNIRQTKVSDKFVNGIAAAFVQATGRFGVSSAGASFGAGFNDSDGGKFAVEATVGGLKYDPGQIKITDANMALEASRAVFFALQSSDLPQYLAKVFDGITASTATLEQIDAATNYAVSLKSIRDALTETRTPLQVLQANVDSAFTTLGTSAASFKTDFVAAIDAGISPERLVAFQELGANLSALDAATGKAADGIVASVRSVQDIANERKTLDERYAQATLNQLQLIDRARESLDASNQVRYDEVIAAEAAKTAAEKLADAQTEAAEKAKQAAEQLKATNDGLKDRLDVLTGAQTDRSLQLRDATDKSTQALLRQIFAQEDAKTAAEESARAQQQAADAVETMTQRINSAISSLGDTRFDLENQLLTLQGNTGEVATRNRTADLAKLTTGITDEAQVKAITEAYDYNESLKAQIKSFGDAKAAADAAAESQSRAADESANAAKAAEAAANSVRDAMKSIADSLLNEAARIRGDLQLASNQSYATAQARFTVTAAQAKAGDTEAAKLLPELARTLTELARTNATSANELRNVRAATAGALEDVASKLGAQFGFQTPASAAISAPQITNTMVAYQPPQVGLQAQSQPLFINTMTSAQPPSDTTGSAAQLQQLNALVMTLKADSEKLVASNDKIRLILQLVTQNGEAMLTTPA